MTDQKNIQGISLDYLDLLNSWIPRRWFQISRATGFRIQGRLGRKVCSVTNRYEKASGSIKKKELDGKTLSLSILVHELVSIEDIKDNIAQAKDLVEEWRRRYSELKKNKDNLAQEMAQVLERKQKQVASLNEDLSDYIEKISSLEEETVTFFNGKSINSTW